MRFGGAGLAMIFVSFLNVILSKGAARDSPARRLVYVANLLTLAFGAMAVALDSEPQDTPPPNTLPYPPLHPHASAFATPR